MESVDGVGSYVYPQHQSTRWNPTSEQVRILKELYYRNGIRSPSAEQIQRISWKLRRYGKIEGKNVFYWFQNHKARERQKKRLCTSMVENPVSFDMGRSIPFNFGIKPMERRCSCLEECSETAKGCTKRIYEPTFREECVANYSMSPLEQNYLLNGNLCQELRHHVEILRKTVSMESCEQSREEYWSDGYLHGLVKENRHLKTLQLFPTNREDGSLKSDNENICGSSDMGREDGSTWGAVYEHIREREALDLRLNTFNEVVDEDELV